jgi:putative ABC transport system permease protein
VISQFALAVVLLSSAGLLIRSYFAVEAVDPGVQARNVVTMQLRLYASDEVHDRVMARIRAIPGVQSVGAINDIFLGRGGKSLGTDTLDVEGHAAEPRDQWKPLLITPNSGDAFQAMGMRLLKGRLFSEHDGEHDPLVVIVNEAMARRFWRGEDPVGKRFKGYPGNTKDWVTVIGLVKDLRNAGLEHEAVSQMFAAPRQFKPGAILVVRTTEEPERLQASVRRVLREIDPRAAVGQVSTLAEQLDAQFAQRRFQSLLLAIFSALALALAAVGIFGLLHYSVSRRTREIGVRMALGARPQEVVRMVLRQGLTLAAAGLALGLAVAFVVARAIASLLFEVRPHDPATFVVVTGLLALVATLACYIPARKASRVDPMEALRCG